MSALTAWAAPAAGWRRVLPAELAEVREAATEALHDAATLAAERVADLTRRSRPRDVATPGCVVQERWTAVDSIGVHGDDPALLCAWLAAARALGVGRTVALLRQLDPLRAVACLGADEVWVGDRGLDPDVEPLASLERVGPEPAPEAAAVVAGAGADAWRVASTMVALAARHQRVEVHLASRQLHDLLRTTLGHVLVNVTDPTLDARVARAPVRIHPTLDGAMAAAERVGAAVLHLLGTGDARPGPGAAALCVVEPAVVGLDVLAGALAPDPRLLLRRERTFAPPGEWVGREAGPAAAWQALLAVGVGAGGTLAVGPHESERLHRAARSVGVHARAVPADADAPWEPSVPAVLAAARSVGWVALSSPGLETGHTLHPGLFPLVGRTTGARVIVDETLGELAAQDLRALGPDEHLVLVRPLAYGLARAGVDARVIVAAPPLVEALADPLADAPDLLTAAAVALLDRHPDAAEPVVRAVSDARAAMAYALGAAGAVVLDGEGDFVLVQPEDRAAELAAAGRAGAGDRVRPGPAGTLRFSV